MVPSLQEFLVQYIAVRCVCNGYGKTLQKRCAKLSAFSGRLDMPGAFTETTINAFLGTLAELSPYTQNKYRQDFLAVWRAAADEDHLPYPQARRIRRIKAPERPIECYLEFEARALALAAERMPGAYPNGVARRHYWPAVIRAAWDSGLRRGDVWNVTRAMIQREGVARIVQRKTGKLITCRFHRSTILRIDKAGGSLVWPVCEWCFGEHFQEVVTISQIGRGTFRWLRRGSGSRIDADHPGRGHEHLGNGRQVFDAHYNARLNDGNRPMPPEL